mgnify:CR=1 FL=1
MQNLDGIVDFEFRDNQKNKLHLPKIKKIAKLYQAQA